jgi:hypothetical protein
MKRVLLATAAACSLCSMQAWADFRAYEVEARYRQEVYEALRDLLAPRGANTFALGKAEMLPTGQILVDAAPETHQQIEAILQGISELQPSPAPRVTMRYWVVLGSEEAAPQANIPELLRDVVDELQRVNGGLSFRVVGSATLVTDSGQRGVLEGRPVSIEQESYADGSTLYADIEIRFVYPERFRRTTQANIADEVRLQEQVVDLQTTIQAGEFVVVGENTVDTEELDGKLFYIVHWPTGE